MPKFSANLGFLWPELSLVDRIYAARNAGFAAVECHWPYDTQPEDVNNALQQTGLTMLGLNTTPGDLSTGEFGLGAVPGREQDARTSIDHAIQYGRAINAVNVHLMAGISEPDVATMETFHSNLKYASNQAETANMGILIEPINPIDRPGYSLSTVNQAIGIIERLRRENCGENVGIMFDCYHVQMTEGNLLARLEQALPFITHIQIAAVPGRAEPNQGEINYPWLFEAIDDLGYSGYIGAEYQPSTTTDRGLDWFAPYSS